MDAMRDVKVWFDSCFGLGEVEKQYVKLDSNQLGRTRKDVACQAWQHGAFGP